MMNLISFLTLLMASSIFQCSKSTQINSDQPFLWGVATSAFQSEGSTEADGRGKSIWDEFSKLPGKIENGDLADKADESYVKYREDISLVKALGLNAYRFSISWTRIFPNGTGEPNRIGINHYNNIINSLLESDIEPMVTLFHWDFPLALENEYDGWLSNKSVEDFKRFAGVCFENFGDRVKIWTTMNEPWTYCYMGYDVGTFAPGRCSNRNICDKGDSSTEVYLAAHNMLLAHAAAVDLYRRKYQTEQNGKIGIVLNLDWGEPLTQSSEDIIAANIKNEFGFAWFADPIYFGHYPTSMISKVGNRLPSFTAEEINLLKGSVDFLGINHYTTRFYAMDTKPRDSTQFGGWFRDQGTIETKFTIDGNLIGEQGASSWLNAVPWGFRKMLLWITERYRSDDGTPPIIYVTENGCDCPDETVNNISTILNDDFRIRYHSSYIKEMINAIQHGADIRGYFVWSLSDNWEWKDGYSYRFGLHFVDYSDPELPRIRKKSANWYQDFVKTNGNNPPFARWTDSMKFWDVLEFLFTGAFDATSGDSMVLLSDFDS